MAMVELARQPQDDPICLGEIAERQGLSAAYLEQLFIRLRRAELVASVRGKQGGYHLAKTPEEISIADIMSAADESVQTTRCGNTDHKGCQGTKAKCATHNLWTGLERQIQNYFRSITLQDVCEGRIQPTGEVCRAA